MKGFLKKAAAAAITFAFIFTVIPMLSNDLDAYAATSKPAATKILKVTKTPVTVKLKWKKVTRNCSGYKIYRNGKLRKTINSKSKVTFTDKNLKANTVYKYSVRTFRKTVTWKGSRKITLGKMSKVKTVRTSKPAAPTLKLSATKYEDSCDVELTWNKVPGAKKYFVYRNGKKITSTTSTDTLNTLRAAGAYKYTIKAYANGGYSAASNARSYTYGASSGSDPVPGYDKDDPTLPDPPVSPTHRASNFGIDKNVKFTYAPNGTSFYLGQKWTAQLQNSLMSGTSGMEKVTRPKVIHIAEWPADGGPAVDDIEDIDQYIYLFDIGDYSDFLAVYVADNQILQWRTTCKNMGSDHGVALTRGTVFTNKSGNAAPYEKTLISYRRKPSTANVFTDVPNDGVIVGGYSSQKEEIRDPNGNSLTWGIYSHIEQNRYAEKRIGFHFINALRIAARMGLAPYTYNDTLDGHDNVATVIDENGNPIETRYGAQAWAETMKASKNVTHGTLSQGPLAGQSSETRDMYMRQIQNRNRLFRENCGTGTQGEACISVYEGSGGHEAAILDQDSLYIGIGFAGGYHCEQFQR